MLLLISWLSSYSVNEKKYRAVTALSKTGDIILFPSYLQHAVKIRNIDKSTRTSLAFNVFVKGNLGNNYNLTELILKWVILSRWL